MTNATKTSKEIDSDIPMLKIIQIYGLTAEAALYDFFVVFI